ncbi:peroxiredoxin Q/BCP [Sphingomonas sp. PP-CE-3G-477]|uniref:peroxiredoxin n=1 Tax=Sphingomonas sp. PP-CE-3G-477 TaxID=2135660 RepID=UPI000D38F4B2|nr:peroxiredoxin [Sphingomonas sp. PP-CE-3G-477]PTQ64283.1 peroxiredoxin Q/BCP [Sphingomonas sp. PP-CE-3G-477]
MDEGSKVPDVTVTIDDAPVSLANLGTPLVVYFYPKDDTAGCTTEAKDFTALANDFAAAGVTVVGVSKDTPAAHAKFTAKHALAVQLASDVDGAACEAFGVWVEKAMYGRKYMGIERATFLFGADGTLAKTWRKVRVAGHADAVLATAKAL